VTPRGLVETYRRFAGRYCLHLQSWTEVNMQVLCLPVHSASRPAKQSPTFPLPCSQSTATCAPCWPVHSYVQHAVMSRLDKPLQCYTHTQLPEATLKPPLYVCVCVCVCVCWRGGASVRNEKKVCVADRGFEKTALVRRIVTALSCSS
jgi:hypothetical protein